MDDMKFINAKNRSTIIKLCKFLENFSEISSL